jgi:hypothetical protein
MNLRYFEHKDNPQIVRIVDVDTGFVSGTVGQQPKEYVESDWVDKGEASFAKAQEEVSKIFAEFRKPDNKKDAKARAKKLYDAVIAAGNSPEVAKQVSGYLGA